MYRQHSALHHHFGVARVALVQVEMMRAEAVKEELAIYKGESPFFFGGDKPIADNTLRRVFIAYCKKAEMKPIRIHDLRHSFVSMCIHLGANIMVVADLIGDTVEQVTKTYGHLYETDKREIIDKI